MSHPVYNFSAGPAVLPRPVLERARAELVDYRGTGMSVMEMSHRSPAYEAIHEGARAKLAELLAVPEGFTVLLLQGGASLQFSMVPMGAGHLRSVLVAAEIGLWGGGPSPR
jgi:phosphoserine aminotransferase